MQLLDEHNAAEFLRRVGWIAADADVGISALSGGVSNQVLYVAFRESEREDFVLKQSRPQLRVPDPWFCGVERIWREVEALHVCQDLLTDSNDWPAMAGAPLSVMTPRILHEDRDDFVFAMTAAPRTHRVWKRDLLEGRAEASIAAACGSLLGRMHAASWLDLNVMQRLDDRKTFDELRIDPYYRTVAYKRPDAAPAFERLIESVWSHRRALVHADFSPKNLLVYPGGMMMVDFETCHYGDPAFDLGFFLSHLVLKAIYHRSTTIGEEPLLRLTDHFWSSYREQVLSGVGDDEYITLVARAVLNFAGCAWARVDGKSQVDYLWDEVSRDVVRSIARDVFEAEPRDWGDVLSICRQTMSTLPIRAGGAS